MTKRTTPEDDFERLAERVNGHSDGIVDRDSFDVAFDEYMLDDKNIPGLRNKVWNVTKLRKGVSNKRLHKERGGKSLKRDRQTTARVVVTDVKNYKDARHQDLKGYDTKKVTSFTRRGRQSGRVVVARQIFIQSGGKRQARFIGRNGRYVSVTKRTKTSR